MMEFFSTVSDFISMIVDWVVNLVEGTLAMARAIAAAVPFILGFMYYIPYQLYLFIALTLLISVVYLFIGRKME